MAEASWDSALAFVFSAEGGYTDDPQDPGGATNLGITLAELGVWRHTAVTKADVQSLGQDEAAAIYRTNYWNASRCVDMPAGVDLMVFDASVNVGNGRSAKLLQAALGVAVDGSIGPQTLAAIAGGATGTLIDALATGRLAFYRSLSTFSHFGGGWTNRVNRVHDLALSMSTGDRAH